MGDDVAQAAISLCLDHSGAEALLGALELDAISATELDDHEPLVSPAGERSTLTGYRPSPSGAISSSKSR